MENINNSAPEPGYEPNQPPYAAPRIPRKNYSRDDVRYKSPLLATILSLMPGLGQVYIGYYRQGFINIFVIAGVISLLASEGMHDNFIPFLSLFLAFYWLFNMVDAYRKSVFYNQALSGLGAFEMPEEEKLAGNRGSLLGGVLMIAVGGIALSYTRYGFSLDWIEVWWPVAPILMGLYLIYQPLVKMIKKRNG